MTSKVRKILALGIGTLVIVGGIGISGIKSGVGEADMVSIGNEPVAMSGEDPDEIEELETEEPEEEPEQEPEEEEEQEEPEEEAEEPEEETEEDSQSGSEESEEESADAGEDENALLGADDSNNKIEVSASEITIDDSKLVYDGNPQLPTVKYNGTTLTKDNDYTIEVNGGDAVDAGSYHARITLKGEYTCQDTIERNFTIAKAKAIADGRLKPNITVDGDTIIIKNTTTLCQYKVIEGTSATASELGETGDEVDESGEVIKKEKLADGKTYAVYYRVKGSDNYEAGEWKLVTTAKIEILPLVTQLPTANKLTYNGTDQELVTAGTTNQGTIKYATEKEGQYSTTIPTGKNAGSYTVWWVIDSDSSNKDSTPVSVSVTIAKKQVTVSGTISATKKYDGKIKAEVDWTKLTLSGVID
ncbi:MAG: hypothetical protein IKW81_11060, partial [Pseudobutyrivibrio sp.]|nr:hypothetical protein [Pseudobutyrivibrio sp.]